MVKHALLGSTETERAQKLFRLIKNGKITFGGYSKAMIYGTLRCASGKRMKLENRVFFEHEQEAISMGYRPCGNCLPEKYKMWKAGRG